MGGKPVILYRRGRNFAWIRPWIHLDPLGARMRQVYYLQHFCLDPCLDPLGSTWIHDAQGVLFTTPLLGSELGSTCNHYQAGVLFATLLLCSRRRSTWIHWQTQCTRCILYNNLAWIQAWIYGARGSAMWSMVTKTLLAMALPAFFLAC